MRGAQVGTKREAREEGERGRRPDKGLGQGGMFWSQGQWAGDLAGTQRARRWEQGQEAAKVAGQLPHMGQPRQLLWKRQKGTAWDRSPPHDPRQVSTLLTHPPLAPKG